MAQANKRILKSEAIRMAAALARGDGLSVLYGICEDQKTVSTKKVLEHVERTQNFMAECAIQMRKLADMLEQPTNSYLNGGHEMDEDGCCVLCGFDSAEFWWWRRNTHEGRESGKEMPICAKINDKHERPNSRKT